MSALVAAVSVYLERDPMVLHGTVSKSVTFWQKSTYVWAVLEQNPTFGDKNLHAPCTFCAWPKTTPLGLPHLIGGLEFSKAWWRFFSHYRQFEDQNQRIFIAFGGTTPPKPKVDQVQMGFFWATGVVTRCLIGTQKMYSILLH